MADHDTGYRMLFSHPEMVADLLRGFVREDWVGQLDFSTLERVPATFVSDKRHKRESDVIWRLRWRGGDRWLYVYLLLEFQSTVDPFMAVRVMTYVGLLYQELIRQRLLTPEGLLPRSCRSFSIMEKPSGGPLRMWRSWWRRSRAAWSGTGRGSATACSTKGGSLPPTWNPCRTCRRR